YASCTVDAFGALDECLDEVSGDMTEHRSNQLLEWVGPELVDELELDLARGFGERAKRPRPVETAKRTISQFYHDALGRLIAIGRREMRARAVVIDVDANQHVVVFVLELARAGAPRQEQRIVFDALDQIEHLMRTIGDEHRLVDAGHCY